MMGVRGKKHQWSLRDRWGELVPVCDYCGAIGERHQERQALFDALAQASANEAWPYDYTDE